MPIGCVLFDADGVTQYATVHWQPGLKLALALESDEEAAQLLVDIFEAETAVLARPTGFVEQLQATLTRWNRAGHVAAALEVMHSIETHADIIHVVQRLRRQGMRCCVASNQQSLRAAHMSRGLNYQALFDREFYSCFVGAAKPHAAFFERVVAELGCEAGSVLFLDDRAENVEGARRAGLQAAPFFGSEGAGALERRLAEFGVVLAPPARSE